MRPAIALALLIVSSSAHAQNISLPKTLLEDAFKTADCQVEIDEVNKDLEFAGDLSNGQKLIEVSCWRAAYNFGSIYFAADPADLSKARLISFQTLGEGGKLVSTFQLSNPSFDEKTKRIESFHKGRGVGDCGTAGEWRWNGREFVLVRYWNKSKCDGEPFDIDERSTRWLVYPPKQKRKK